MAKVDVLLPYWGDFRLLEEAVDSVIRQTEPDWHLYIIDDCYPSEEAAKQYGSTVDSRITYIRHSKNIGITRNFNYGISIASAEYCMIMGCDDKLLPEYLERALSKIGTADMYQPGVDVINGHGNIYLPLGDRIKRLLQPNKAGVYGGEKLAASLCNGNWLYFPSILWKTSAIKGFGFDDTYKIAEDVVLELSMIMNGSKLYFDTYTSFQYRRFSESLSSKEKARTGVRFGEEKKVYEDFADRFNTLGWSKAARSARWRITSRLHHLIS